MGIGDPLADSVQEGRVEMGRHLDILAERLMQQDWLVGEYSLADLRCAPLTRSLDDDL
jgi:glutathione S-transferase